VTAGAAAALRPWLALALAAVGCATAPTRVELPDRPPLPPDARPLAFVGGAATGFSRPTGGPCQRPPVEPRRGLLGWTTREDDWACRKDTLDEGLAPSSLELRFRGAIPADGRYQLLARGLTVDAWGRVVARGGALGDYVARARMEYLARTPSCTASHVLELARAQVTGPWERAAAFGGWIVLPDLVVEGCRANEVLEVRLRLVGEVNRGRVDVESFGVVASRPEELQEALALRLIPEPDPTSTSSPTASSPAPAPAPPPAP
jgi:hypothetical protein